MPSTMVTQHTLFRDVYEWNKTMPITDDPNTQEWGPPTDAERNKVLAWMDKYTNAIQVPPEIWEEWRASHAGGILSSAGTDPAWWWERGIIVYRVIETGALLRQLIPGATLTKTMAAILGIPLDVPPRHPVMMAYGPAVSGMEGVWMFTEQHNIIRTANTPPYVKTHNGGVVSVGAVVGTVIDSKEEEAAFAVGQELSDATVLAFVLGLARWTSRADRRNPRSYAVVTVNEYCEMRGFTKHHKGGYKTEHKAIARREMLALNKVWVRHKIPEHIQTRDGGRDVEGQLMVVSVETRGTGGIYPTAFRMSPGTWADDYLADNPGVTALVLDHLLRLDTSARTGQIAFRLGLYMALNWRTKFMHNNVEQPHAVRSLLVAMGVDPESIKHREERKRIRSYLIGALDLLQERGVIGLRDEQGMLVDDWHYANAEAGDPDAHDNWADWLRWTVHIPPPPEVGAFYETPMLARGQAIKAASAQAKRSRQAKSAAQARHADKGEGGSK